MWSQSYAEEIIRCAFYGTVDTDITARSSQARRLFGSMNQQVLSNKRIPIGIRRRLYQALLAI
jgi:hypothetical protein